MASGYLEGLPRRRALRARRVLGLWVPLAVVLFVLWRLMLGPGDLGWLLGQLLAVVVALLLVLRGRKGRSANPEVARELATIERQLLRGEYDAAITSVRSLLAGGQNAYDRARALFLLGQVAESRGHLEQAVEVYAEAASTLPARRGLLGMAFAQLAPAIDVRRAFCLAAGGRLDEAQRVLDGARHRDELPGVRALAVRAQALLHARRGEHQALVELVSREHVRIKNGLVHRDRALLRVLSAWGRSCVGGAFRAPPPPALGADPELRAWIARAIPEAARMLESP